MAIARPKSHQTRRELSAQNTHLYFRVTIPATDNKPGKNNHCRSDDQNISPGARFGWSRLRAGKLSSRLRNWRRDDDLLAGRTIDLFSRIARGALDILAALRAGEFEFSHGFVSQILPPAIGNTILIVTDYMMPGQMSGAQTPVRAGCPIWVSSVAFFPFGRCCCQI